MDRQDIGSELCDDLQHIGQKSRLILHLKGKCDRRSPGMLMELKYICFLLVKRAPADSHLIGCFVDRVCPATVEQLLGFHYF